ncbi:MAG: hypothetical protein PVH29_11625 [Candidatus Zixiibacteriota bacterium]|jgi:hypothetical protein
MNRTFLITLTLLCAVGVSFAAMGSIVSSFQAPTNNIRGMAHSGTYIHVLVHPNAVYHIHPTNGSVYGSWNVPSSSSNRGLAYTSGGHIWVGSYNNDTLYDCNWLTGSVIHSFPISHDPYGLAPQQTGDGGAGATAVFVSDSDPSYTWRHSLTNGSVLSSFTMPLSDYRDITYDHRNDLLWGAYGPDIYGYSADGFTSIVASFPAPPSTSYGMAYYNSQLFIGCTNGYIYRIDCPANVNVAPASLGKVRALYQ